jgi:hypothetical protein
LRDGLSSNANGNTSGTLNITGTPVSFGTVGPFLIAVQDSLNYTMSQQFAITVNPPSTLAITTTQKNIANGVVGLPYNPTTISASNGTTPYTWSIVSGSLPAGLTLNSSTGQISGQPTDPTPCSGYPPSCTSTFVVQVQDSNSATNTAPFSITVLPAGTNNNYLYGHYAMLFQGFVDNTNGQGATSQTAAVAAFQVDGKGNISSGRVYINDGNGNSGNANATNYPNGFTGTYSIGADNRGVIALNTCITSTACFANNYANQQFTIAVGQIQNISLSSGTCPTGGNSNNSACPLYTDGRMVEFDDAGATPSGVHGQGRLFWQKYGQFNTLSLFQSNVAGNWVFGFEGEDASQNPLAAAGIFALGSAACVGGSGGGCSGGTIQGNIVTIADINDNSNVIQSPSDSAGNYTSTGATTSNGQFAVNNVMFSSSPQGYPGNYIFVMINPSRAIGMSWGPHSQSSLVSGLLYKQQQSSYSQASAPAAAVVYMSGAYGNSTDAWLAQMTCNNNTSQCTVNASDDNLGGTYVPHPLAGTTSIVNIDSTGRWPLTGSGNFAPVFYLYDSSSTGGGYGVNTGTAELGYLSVQGTAPTSVSALGGSYYMGNMFGLNAGGSADSGTFTVDSSGNMTGNDDSGSQGYTNYGNSISGMSFTTPNSYGVWNIQASGQNQVVCYLIEPVCSGGASVCGSSTPYASYACIDTTGNGAKVTLVRQVQ